MSFSFTVSYCSVPCCTAFSKSFLSSLDIKFINFRSKRDKTFTKFRRPLLSTQSKKSISDEKVRFVPNKKVYFTRVCRKIFFAKFSTKYSFICRCELVDSTGSMSCLIHRDMYDRHSASLALPGTVIFLKNVTVVKQSNGTLSGIVTPNNLVNIILLLLQMPHSHCTRFQIVPTLTAWF